MIILNPGWPGDGGEPGGGDEELHESRLQGRHRDLEHPPTRGQLGREDFLFKSRVLSVVWRSGGFFVCKMINNPVCGMFQKFYLIHFELLYFLI